MVKALLFDFAGVIMKDIDDSTGSVILNQELLTFLKPLKDRYRLGIYTSSYQLMYAPNTHPTLGSLFHTILFAKQLQWPKSEPESYLKVASELKLEPEEIFFTDDTPRNVLAAQQAGMLAIDFSSNHELFDHLQPLIGLE